MTQNIILFGPPGTGKTYHLQEQIRKYTDYKISDDFIKNNYNKNPSNWFLLGLIILQSNGGLSSLDIANKIKSLSIKVDKEISTILVEHSEDKNIKIKPPIIFQENNGLWYLINIEFILGKIDIKDISSKRYAFVTFHQSFSYEDFIEGIKAISNQENNTIDYKKVDGVFKLICDEARKDPNREYALFIDEINRGNIADIFGELISLIEIDKRENSKNSLEITLPCSKELFSVPKNLNIIATMNSVGKSISTIDIALRRRFDFIDFNTDYNQLKVMLKNQGIDAENFHGINLVKLLLIINKRITFLLDEQHNIGHAFFNNIKSFDDLKKIFVNKIIPTLEEYFFDDLEKIQHIFNDLDEDNNLHKYSIYNHSSLLSNDLFTNLTSDYPEEKKTFFINKNITEGSFIKVYEKI